MSVEPAQFNLLAVILGGLLYMVYGGVYYSALVGNKKDSQTSGPFKYIYSVILAFVSSFIIGSLITSTGAEGMVEGLGLGFLVGLIIVLVYIKNTLFGLISKRSLYIAIGDHLVIFTLLGALHGWMN